MLKPEKLLQTVVDRRFVLTRHLGKGSFGWVYAADEMALGRVMRRCAIKLLSPESDAERTMVLREIEGMSQLSHPNLITLFGAGSVDDGLAEGCVYLAMELGEQTLHDRLKRPERVTPDEARTIARHLAEALAYLADRGAVHRDLKPANVFRVNGAWKVGDFGLVRAVQGSVDRSSAKGTPLYMAPDQAMGQIGPAADVWALGVILQEALSGRFPYEVDDAYMARLVTEEPRVAAGLPTPFDAIVQGCLQKDRTARWSARRVLEALEGRAAAAVAVRPAPATVEPAAPRVVAAPSGLVSLGLNPRGFQEYRNAKDGSVLIQVPAGTFTMGSNEYDGEKPPHRVTLDPFYIGRLEVTNAQFAAFVRAKGHSAAGDWQMYAREWGDDCPVVSVSWNDAVAYCQWAGLRLPSEAEWEYAARGTEGRKWPWGDAWDADRAWWGQNSGGRAHTVGTKPLGASPCGALDMAGNVWEWCSSKYAPYPYAPRDGREDRGGSDVRVLRGGSWNYLDPVYFRGANRFRLNPDYGASAGVSVWPGPPDVSLPLTICPFSIFPGPPGSEKPRGRKAERRQQAC